MLRDLPVGFRAARPDDAEVITRYHHESWVAGLSHLFPDGVLAAADPMAKFERWQSWLEPDSEFTTVVAERDGTAVGHTTVRDAELVHLFINPEHQGEGLGSQLLAIGESLLASAGHRSIKLQTLVGNSRAVALYESRGWVVTDELIPGEWFGHQTEEHVLTKQLS